MDAKRRRKASDQDVSDAREKDAIGSDALDEDLAPVSRREEDARVWQRLPQDKLKSVLWDTVKRQHAAHTLRCCLSPSRPLLDEWRYFARTLTADGEAPLLKHSVGRQIYLKIRNLVCYLWSTRGTQRHLHFDVVRSHLPEALVPFGRRVYDFLVQYGWINWGLCLSPETQHVLPELAHMRGDTTRLKEDVVQEAVVQALRGHPIPLSAQMSHRVLVIGAGPAGVCAARQLRRLGHRVIVLEARDRVGGRTWTRNFGDVGIDQGASLITGPRGNPVTVLLRQDRSLDNKFSQTTQVGFECKIYGGVDTNKITPEADDTALAEFDRLLDIVNVLARFPDLTGEQRQHYLRERELCVPLDKKQVEDCAAGLFKVRRRLSLLEAMQTAATKLGLLERWSPVIRSLVAWHIANMEYGCAAPLNKVSLTDWDSDEGAVAQGRSIEWKGAHFSLKRGYQTMVQTLAEDLDVRLEHPVSCIEWTDFSTHGDTALEEESSSGSGGVTVHANGVTLKADAAVVTVPLGVLKSKQIKFDPPLPKFKRRALKNLGAGLLNKIVLVYDECFWPDVAQFGWCHIDDTPDEWPSRQRGRHFMFWNMRHVTGVPALVALCAGDSAEELEKGEPDEKHTSSQQSELIQAAVQAAWQAARMAGSTQAEQAPEPSDMWHTRWASDPYAQMSYSYVSTGGEGSDYDRMRRPCGRIFWAGEATCREHPTKVAGALWSALRVAGDVHQALLDDTLSEWLREKSSHRFYDTRRAVRLALQEQQKVRERVLGKNESEPRIVGCVGHVSSGELESDGAFRVPCDERLLQWTCADEELLSVWQQQLPHVPLDVRQRLLRHTDKVSAASTDTRKEIVPDRADSDRPDSQDRTDDADHAERDQDRADDTAQTKTVAIDLDMSEAEVVSVTTHVRHVQHATESVRLSEDEFAKLADAAIVGNKTEIGAQLDELASLVSLDVDTEQHETRMQDDEAAALDTSVDMSLLSVDSKPAVKPKKRPRIERLPSFDEHVSDKGGKKKKKRAEKRESAHSAKKIIAAHVTEELSKIQRHKGQRLPRDLFKECARKVTHKTVERLRRLSPPVGAHAFLDEHRMRVRKLAVQYMTRFLRQVAAAESNNNGLDQP
ncbi:MAG: hypothetical protein MHM6MM_003772 [Cercozoa sp. M6MM]